MENSEIVLMKMSKMKVTPYKIHLETGIDQSTFSKWKKKPTSKIDVSIIQKIASFMCIGIDELLENNQVDQRILYAYETALLTKYRQLNHEGQEKADGYIDDLISSGKYEINDIIFNKTKEKSSISELLDNRNVGYIAAKGGQGVERIEHNKKLTDPSKLIDK